MRREGGRAAAEHQDLSLPGGCMLCDGDLELRLTGNGAQTYCSACRWLSRARVRRDGETVHVSHPGLVA